MLLQELAIDKAREKSLPPLLRFGRRFTALISEDEEKRMAVFLLIMGKKIPHALSFNLRRTSDVPESTAKNPEMLVLINDLGSHMHPKRQRTIVSELREMCPSHQFIVTTNSPIILQSLNEGEVIDLDRTGLSKETIQTVPLGTAAPGPHCPYSGRSIEDILEGVMGMDLPQRSLRWQRMHEAATEYYRLLRSAKDNGQNKEELARLKRQLDELAEPFSDDPAYCALLAMERAAAGL